MAFVVRWAKTIRNNWKKSTFAACALAYGVSYAKDKYEINNLMREYCEEAKIYGDQLLPIPHEPKRVIVILNPAANKKKAKETFESYAEPILHLGGFLVEIVKTDSEGHARRYVEDLPKLPSAILVAGGEGTLSEAVTGLCRRAPHERCPIGVLPVGRTNSVAKKIFNVVNPSKVQNVEALANAAISVVREQVEPRDTMKIEIIDQETQPKPVYAVGSLKWGAFRDIMSKRDKYWYFGGLRDYSAFLFNAFSDDITWQCKASLEFTDPCSGCRNCRVNFQPPKPQNKRWWSIFVPRSKPVIVGPDFSKIENPNCSVTHQLEVAPTEFEVITRNLEDDDAKLPHLKIQLGKEGEEGFTFMTNSWSRVWNRLPLTPEKTIDARSVVIRPAVESTEDKELYYSIDNENYEVKPIRVSVEPDAINMYVMKKTSS
ncbi:acylglycerol kinase, mitochondrial [Culicoides brevitarsis]|uniref:acylglycerol kinase, mitochondrial n=1 Tax=Culicoides brevitarsis TaxID=469753 RepID=UPI00307C1476